ncbi:DnaJ domain-containing protein [Marinobacterium sp. YM272]|uniref:DnaJ domain-containing protein n=1 Tax=Marinobacterium sp. YM272 TaxID=3421654 RepID=UPI003D7F632A
MSHIPPSSEEEFWVIWSPSLGVVDTVSIERIEDGPQGRQAWLDEPYEMVGPISLDALEEKGQVNFAACRVMSRQRWQRDQVELRRESRRLRREAQQREQEAFVLFNRRRMAAEPSPFEQYAERGHRESLDLPAEGPLDVAQIKSAYRRLAQKHHPDAGGSQEQFVKITAARDELLSRVS